jgi:low temperature requirement protein LtrA
MLQAFSETHDSFTQMVAFYLAARLFTAIYYAVIGFLAPLVKGMMIVQVLNILLGAAFWIASTTISTTTDDTTTATSLRLREASGVSEAGGDNDEGPLNAARLVLVFIALAIDLFGSVVPVYVYRYSRTRDSAAARAIGRFFEFYPAINIEHKVERTNAFISLVFGYSVVGVLFQSAGVFPLNAFLGKAILGLTQAAVFNWLYFEVDGNSIRTHAIRRGASSGEYFCCALR